MLHAADDLAPNRVLAVEEGRIVEADEELAVRRVRIIGTRHRAYAAHMRFSIEFLRQIWLGRTAHAGAVRATALRHKAGNHAMELHTVVKAFTGEFLNARYMVRRKIRAQLDNNVAAVEGKGKRFIGHI